MSESSDGVVVRPPLSSEVEEMLEVIQLSYDSWPAFEIPVSALDHLHWKMESDPAAWPHHRVVEIDAKIVGTGVRVEREVMVKGVARRARDGGDSAMRPEYRGRGIHSQAQAYEAANAHHYDLGLGYSQNPAVLHIRQRRGDRSLGNRIQVLFKALDVGRLVQAEQRRSGSRMPPVVTAMGIRTLAILQRLRHPPFRRPPAADCSVTRIDLFDERTDAFFEEAERPFDFIVARRAKYLNWRYCDIRGGKFVVWAAEEGGRIVGYAVLKLETERGHLVDLLALPDRLDVVRTLVDEALGTFEKAGVAAVSCWMVAHHPYGALLRSYGFIDARRDVGFAYIPLRMESSELEFLRDKRARVHWMRGDSDTI